ncbi:MAG: DUF2442 domain-containing protein [Bacteroidota bacterium]|jgi:hypothetical protein
MIATRVIKEITFGENQMIIHIDDKVYKWQLDKVSKKLFQANDIQRQFYKVSPSGYGIHWPLIDEDLSVEHLINRLEK